MVQVEESMACRKMIESQLCSITVDDNSSYKVCSIDFIIVRSSESLRWVVIVLCPIRGHIGLHGEWRFGIEAKRLIALVTSIRIHLKSGLETK